MTASQGLVVTFYSYKGGVGRSMALANVAALLTRWGYRTLVVDWDLEAPGLEHFFAEFLDVASAHQRQGVIDLLTPASSTRDAQKNRSDWREALVNIALPSSQVPLDLLTAGNRTDADAYYKRVREFDAQDFYAKADGGRVIEGLRREWIDSYKFVLIDSRTGVTELGGICTAHLADVIVLLFTPTQQSFEGAIDVARRAGRARQKLPFDRLSLLTLPIPSRLDTSEEFDLSQDWLDRFATDLDDQYADWVPAGLDIRALLEKTKLPYVSFFSFGEKLPVFERGVHDPAGLAYAYETLAALIAHRLEEVQTLVEQRDEYVAKAQRKTMIGAGGSDIFLSYHSEDRGHAEIITHALEYRGWSVWWDRSIPAGKSFDQVIEEALDATRCVVVLWSRASVDSRWVRVEAREGESRGILIPVLIEKGLEIPFEFRDTQYADLVGWDGNILASSFQELAAAIARLIGPSPKETPKPR